MADASFISLILTLLHSRTELMKCRFSKQSVLMVVCKGKFGWFYLFAIQQQKKS